MGVFVYINRYNFQSRVKEWREINNLLMEKMYSCDDLVMIRENSETPEFSQNF